MPGQSYCRVHVRRACPARSVSLAGHSSTSAPVAGQQATQSSSTLLPVTGVARFVVDQARRSDNPAMQQALQQARYFRVVEALHTAVTSSSHTESGDARSGDNPHLARRLRLFRGPGGDSPVSGAFGCRRAADSLRLELPDHFVAAREPGNRCSRCRTSVPGRARPSRATVATVRCANRRW